MADWVAAYLNAHPAATAKELGTAIPQLDSTLEGNAIGQAQHVFVVAAQRYENRNTAYCDAI
ncbi:MAG: hypothetical protein ABSG03_38290 [Bryobacteraceae bacterium]